MSKVSEFDGFCLPWTPLTRFPIRVYIWKAAALGVRNSDMLQVIVSLRNPGLRERHWPVHPASCRISPLLCSLSFGSKLSTKDFVTKMISWQTILRYPPAIIRHPLVPNPSLGLLVKWGSKLELKFEWAPGNEHQWTQVAIPQEKGLLSYIVFQNRPFGPCDFGPFVWFLWKFLSHTIWARHFLMRKKKCVIQDHFDTWNSQSSFRSIFLKTLCRRLAMEDIDRRSHWSEYPSESDEGATKKLTGVTSVCGFRVGMPADDRCRCLWSLLDVG